MEFPGPSSSTIVPVERCDCMARRAPGAFGSAKPHSNGYISLPAHYPPSPRPASCTAPVQPRVPAQHSASIPPRPRLRSSPRLSPVQASAVRAQATRPPPVTNYPPVASSPPVTSSLPVTSSPPVASSRPRELPPGSSTLPAGRATPGLNASRVARVPTCRTRPTRHARQSSVLPARVRSTADHDREDFYVLFRTKVFAIMEMSVLRVTVAQ